MSQFNYKTKGVCASEISFDINDGIVSNVMFNRGCSGNTSGISKLVDGLPVDYVITKLKGTECGNKKTSCPDQLAQALEKTKLESNK